MIRLVLRCKLLDGPVQNQLDTQPCAGAAGRSLYSMTAWCPLSCSLFGFLRASFINPQFFIIASLHPNTELKSLGVESSKALSTELPRFSYSTFLFEFYAASLIANWIADNSAPNARIVQSHGFVRCTVPPPAGPLPSYNGHYPLHWSICWIIRKITGLVWIFVLLP